MSEMQVEEFVRIIKSLQQDNKELKKQVDIIEEILHSYLPIIENADDK